MSARSDTCAICGGRDFGPGPAGRLAVTGLPPCCRGCGSLERHRSLHHLLSLLPNAMLSWRRAMQFSPDPALRPAWFATHEISVYGGANNLDLQAIDRPAESFDFIVLNHVLEYVPDARRAFSELARILSARGILEVGFSGAGSRARTQDFEVPQGTHRYLHLFGADLTAYLHLGTLGLYPAEVRQADPVTGVVEGFHFFTKSSRELDELIRAVDFGRSLLG